MKKPKYIPLSGYRQFPPGEMERRAAEFYGAMRRRRSVRQFSDRGVPRRIIEDCLRAAGTAPSGANLQPWHFVVVSDPGVKRKIREAAEREEREFYSYRAPREWLDALVPLGTGPEKPFLERAPYLIAVFVQRNVPNPVDPGGRPVRRYFPVESVGLAVGILITALHHSGLASLPYTPSPMGFLNEILGRPENERPFLILVAGYPESDAMVPDLGRKELGEFTTFL